MSTEELLAKATASIKALMKLMDDGDLVRNIEHDHDRTAFIHQGLRIVVVLREARAALALADAK